MEYRNVIKLTERKRQTGATSELFAKFYANKDSVFITNDKLLRGCIIQNNLKSNNLSHLSNINHEELIDRIIYPNSENYNELLDKHSVWYIDNGPNDFILEHIKLAIEKRKTLIGYYYDQAELEQIKIDNENRN